MPPMSPAPQAAVPLCIPLDRTCRSHLLGALQRGVAVPARLPCPVSAFLVQQLGLEPDYVERRISTIFLDGDVVDAAETATLRDGSQLALSAAMPGLVGATLRKGGFYAAMRADITRAADGATLGDDTAPGVVTVRLFNLLIDELSGALLRHGILLGRDEAVALLDALGRPVPPLPPGARVLLTASEPSQP